MFYLFLNFYTRLWQSCLLSHLYREELITNSEYHRSHPYYRRFQENYQKKQSITTNLWIGTGLLSLAFPMLPFIFIAFLLTTFLSLGILDE